MTLGPDSPVSIPSPGRKFAAAVKYIFLEGGGIATLDPSPTGLIR